MKKPFIKIISVSILFYSWVVSAATMNVGYMNITGGSVIIYPTGGGTWLPNLVHIGYNTNLVGGYIGTGNQIYAETEINPYSIISFEMNGFILNSYTAASNLGDIYTPAGSFAGGPVPTGVLDNVNNTITMDLSSFIYNFQGTDYEELSSTRSNASGTWDPITGAYTLSWSSFGAGGGFGTSWDWELSGYASPVPVPASAWLFGSGLIGLAGLARRRKTRNKNN